MAPCARYLARGGGKFLLVPDGLLASTMHGHHEDSLSGRNRLRETVRENKLEWRQRDLGQGRLVGLMERLDLFTH